MFLSVLFSHFPDLDQKELLAQQKQQLNKRLGLDIAGGLSGEELFKEEDLIIQKEEKADQAQVIIIH